MKEAIKYIYVTGSGLRKEFIEKFEGDEKFFDKLALLGYITQGTAKGSTPNEPYLRTWKKTKKAEEYYNVFIRELSNADMARGRFLHSIGY